MKRPLQLIPGMSFATLFNVFRRNKFRIDIRFMGRYYYLILMGALNSILRSCDAAAFRNRIESCRIDASPVFVLGHWRSGTTHLHNLLCIDDQFAFPTAYEAMFPHHFMFSRPSGERIFNFMAPRTRPMDNMPFSAQVPHEDEFALAALCAISPYMRFLFPRTCDYPYSVLDPEMLPVEYLEKWKTSMVYYVKKLTYVKKKRLVLKSPTHLGRVKILLGLFPHAKFIHIVRNPYRVYLSTRRLWEECLSHSHLQQLGSARLDELILQWYETLFALFQRDRGLIPFGSLHEIRFEDLEKAPISSLEQLYKCLGLQWCDDYRKRIITYLESVGDYKKNQHVLTPEDRKRVNTRWRSIFGRYGYPMRH